MVMYKNILVMYIQMLHLLNNHLFLQNFLKDDMIHYNFLLPIKPYVHVNEIFLDMNLFHFHFED